MNDVGILRNIQTGDSAIQYEVVSQHPPDHHCFKCGKFKKKNTNSIYCFKCLGL